MKSNSSSNNNFFLKKTKESDIDEAKSPLKISLRKSLSPKKASQPPQKTGPIIKSFYEDEKEKLRNLAKIILKGSKNTGKEKEILEKKKFILENLLRSVEMQIQQLKSN